MKMERYIRQMADDALRHLTGPEDFETRLRSAWSCLIMATGRTAPPEVVRCLEAVRTMTENDVRGPDKIRDAIEAIFKASVIDSLEVQPWLLEGALPKIARDEEAE